MFLINNYAIVAFYMVKGWAQYHTICSMKQQTTLKDEGIFLQTKNAIVSLDEIELPMSACDLLPKIANVKKWRSLVILSLYGILI